MRLFQAALLMGCLLGPTSGWAQTTFEKDGWVLEQTVHTPMHVEIAVLERTEKEDGSSFRAKFPFANQRGEFSASIQRAGKKIDVARGVLTSSKEGMRLEMKAWPEEVPDPSGLYTYVKPKERPLRELLMIQQVRFREIDAAMSELYEELLRDLDPTRRQALMGLQHAWVDLREVMALSPSIQIEKLEPPLNPRFWEISADMTLERMEWLRHFRGDTVSPDPTGSYLDGMGGILSIKERDDGDWDFACHVVRGPQFQRGFLRGVAQVRENQAMWMDPDPASAVNGQPPALIFIKHGTWVKVIPQNMQIHQGGQAYFDGTYLKVTELVERFEEVK